MKNIRDRVVTTITVIAGIIVVATLLHSCDATLEMTRPKATHVLLDDGRTVQCVTNTSVEFLTCDWEHSK